MALSAFVGLFLTAAIVYAVATGLFPDEVDAEKPGRETGITRLVMVYASQLLLLAGYLTFVTRRSRTKPTVDSRWTVPAAFVLGVVGLMHFFVPVHLTTFVGRFVLMSIRDEPLGPIAHETLREMTESPRDVWLVVSILLVVIAAPIVEEITYRGLVQRSFIVVGFGRWPSIVATAVFFGLVHQGAARADAIAALIVLGIGMGWVAEKSGSLVAPITMHAFFNALNIVLALSAS